MRFQWKLRFANRLVPIASRLPVSFGLFRPSNNNLFELAKNLQNKLQELDDIIQQGGLALKSERESLTYSHFNVKENHILIVNRYRIMAEEDNETE